MKQLNEINLKRLRKSRGFTQEQLGIIAGMTKSQVSKMERGLLGSDATISRVLSALGYRTQITCIDSRSELDSERDRILDILRVFKINNVWHRESCSFWQRRQKWAKCRQRCRYSHKLEGSVIVFILRFKTRLRIYSMPRCRYYICKIQIPRRIWGSNIKRTDICIRRLELLPI